MSDSLVDRLARERRPRARPASALAAGVLASLALALSGDVAIDAGGPPDAGAEPAADAAAGRRPAGLHPTRRPLAATAAVTSPAVHPLVPLALDDARFAFSALGRDWEVTLEPRELLSPAARAELADVALPRLFGGRVVGDERSWARLARDADGRLSGHLFTGGTLYRIEPSARPPGAPDGGAPGPDAGDGDAGYRLVRVGADAGAGALLPRAGETAPDVSRAMRVGIVVDSRYDERHDGRGLARALGIMNGVDGLYRDQLGLAVVVDRVRVHDDPATDPMRSRGGTIEDVLTAFRGVRLGDPMLPADLALVHLFSGHEPADDVIGLGWIDTACRVDGYDVSMSTPFAFDTLLSAHEIAHNLGALHDEDPLCGTDGTEAPGGLMEERLSGDTVTEFSACSLERLHRVLGAGCLVDSLDLALDVRVEAGTAPDERRVALRVSNADPFRTARAVSTRTRLPPGGRVAAPPDGCGVSDDLLVCEHGSIAPAADDALVVSIALPAGSGDAELVAVIDPGDFVDSDPANDRVAIGLRAGGERPSDAPAMRPAELAAAPSDDAPPAGGGAGDAGGAGRTGLPALALLATLAGLRRRRRTTARAARADTVRRRGTPTDAR